MLISFVFIVIYFMVKCHLKNSDILFVETKIPLKLNRGKKLIHVSQKRNVKFNSQVNLLLNEL